MKTRAENTTEQPPERPPNDPPNDPWFMSCQAQDPGPSLTTTWSAELPAPPHPFFIPNHQIKKTNVPPIQKRYVRGMTKGTFPPCTLNVKYAGTTSANNTEYERRAQVTSCGKSHIIPMARRRYRKSHQVVESHIREKESPWHGLFHL